MDISLEFIINLRNWMYFVGVNIDFFMLIVKLRLLRSCVVFVMFFLYLECVLLINKELLM